jgi:hypothetical protein
MPNPFPGMNPYLENIELWKGVHTSLIVHCAEALNVVLPDDYFADAEARVVLEPIHKDYVPDVVVQQMEDYAGLKTRSSVALAELDEPFISIHEDEAEAYIAVRHVSAPDEVVTAIEFLSPTNKNIGRGRDEYLEKQRQWLRLPVNFLEIDLLRGGPTTVAGLINESRLPMRWHYIASLHRMGDGGRFELWPSRLQERLPRLPVPLRPKDGQVALDVGELVNIHYDAGRFSRRIDYSREPAPPLEGEDAAWLDARLKEAALR